MVFDAHEPIGGRRGDLQMAQLLSLLAEVYRDRQQRSKPYRPADFMPEYWWDETEHEPRTPQEWQSLLEMLNTMYGGVDLRDGDGRQPGC